MPWNMKTEKKEWQRLEARVRRTTDLLFGVKSKPENIGGVDVDCVAHKEPDYWICIEITQNQTLDKLREDLAKFAAVRAALFTKNIASKCYFITAHEATPAIKDLGRDSNVHVLSASEYQRLFFDFDRYRTLRGSLPFGSAVDPKSGKKDETKYVPVRYETSSGKQLTVKDIADRLLVGKRIILLGQFGTGKSRCFQELFELLAEPAHETLKYPLAINLRENWGTRRGHEILRRHFDSLGLAELADPVVRVQAEDGLCLLLDGFDEIGSQSWSDDQNKLRHIRQVSLSGVKDLLSSTASGAIISGRDHYFSTQDEMFSALGLSPDMTEIVHCADQFTEEEMSTFLGQVGEEISLPDWLPRRPLMCKVILGLTESEFDAVFESDDGEVDFWNRLIDVICKREATINPVLDGDIIKRVLTRIARTTRGKPQNVGPLTVSEINRAFESVLGFMPVDESAVMLQRLPGLGLGRLDAESTDRRFVDTYILDGLRALDLIEILQSGQIEKIENEKWTNPLSRLGQSILSRLLDDSPLPLKKAGQWVELQRRVSGGLNEVLSADIVASLCRSRKLDGSLDFSGTNLREKRFGHLDLTYTLPARLHLDDCSIDELTLSPREPQDLLMNGCAIGVVHRISSSMGVPPWITECAIDRFESINTTAQIKTANLTNQQRILVAIIKKTFFQKGTGRKEEAMLRGLGREASTSDATKIINILINRQILTKFRGDDGWVYAPVREHAHRMKQMLSELELSKDVLWQEVSALG